MIGRSVGGVLNDLQTLFDHGTIAGLSDGQQLERFVVRRDQVAEIAFAALVKRHGAMVLRVCRQVIGEEHEAQDAAQTVFLVFTSIKLDPATRLDGKLALSRGAPDRDPCAGQVARRREIEWRGGLMTVQCADDGGPTVPQSELYEELDRLPERYRVPLVLCHLEGLTHEQAAQRLRCPVRTVETRLVRGPARLRERLLRRGLVPSAVLASANARGLRRGASGMDGGDCAGRNFCHGGHQGDVGPVSARPLS